MYEIIKKDYNLPIMIRVKGRKISGYYVCIELVHHVTMNISLRSFKSTQLSRYYERI
nr:N1R/p28 family protein [Oriental turtle dovepox virus]